MNDESTRVGIAIVEGLDQVDTVCRLHRTADCKNVRILQVNFAYSASESLLQQGR